MALPMRVPQGHLDPLELMRQDFGSMLSRFLGSREWEETGLMAPYGVDIREDADHIYVEAEVPGFHKDDIDVSLENQVLTIRAEKREEMQQPQQGQKQQKQQQGDFLLRERRYRRFERSFTLPATVDPQHVDAKLQDGILTVTLNKREEHKPRKIQVG